MVIQLFVFELRSLPFCRFARFAVWDIGKNISEIYELVKKMKIDI